MSEIPDDGNWDLTEKEDAPPPGLVEFPTPEWIPEPERTASILGQWRALFPRTGTPTS